jgi:ATP adenylyltransferase
LDHLWSPWRLEYVTGNKPDTGCVFCLAQAGDAANSDQRALIVHQRTTCYVILNLYPYNNGHLLVVPFRHVPSLAALTVEERHEMADLQALCERVLTEAYTPHGINLGVNLGKPAGAGVLEHVHVHIVPRWNGDTNFMTVVGTTRVLPEDLPQSAARLKPIFARLAASDSAS